MISEGKHFNGRPFSNCDIDVEQGKIYRISAIGKYILNPSAIEVEERILGCTLHSKQPKSNALRKKIRYLLPRFSHGLFKDRIIPDENIMMTPFIKTPSFEDEHLENYLKELGDLVRPYHPVLKKIAAIKPDVLDDVSGICEDIGGNNHYRLNLKGSLTEKIEYIRSNIGRTVRVALKNAYLADGLFEMRGFDFSNYDPGQFFYLVKYLENGAPRYAVLDASNTIDFHVHDNLFIRFLHILEQSLQSNENLRDAFRLCVYGNAKPLRLFFTKQLDVNYSNTYLPALYRKFFEEYQMVSSDRKMITDILNNYQRIVTFSYIPRSKTGDEKMYTNISVMHDIRALEPVKMQLPEFYSKITEIASNSEAGSYYLLDSMKGSKDV